MEEILNNWLQEKPKDKFDKELHKYTYYDLMEFAEHYHALQLHKTQVMSSFKIRKEAQKQIYKCKESCYGKKTNASNVGEGDYGRWKDWEDVLVKFAKHIVVKNSYNS